MNTGISPEPGVVEPVEPLSPERVKIREDRELAEAVRDYLEEVERFEDARVKRDAKMQALRLLTDDKPNATLVVSGGYGKYYGKTFLLTVRDSGNFQVSPVEVI